MANKCGVNTQCYIDSNGIDSEKKTVEVVLTDESPIAWYHPEIGRCTLILDHTEEAIDLSRKDMMSIFWSHNDYSLPLGIYENVRIEDSKLKASAHFDRDDKFAMKVFGKVQKGLLKGLSAGLTILEKEITTDNDGKVTVRATKWQPYEGSFTGNPANENAKVGLSNQNQHKEIPMENGKVTFNDAKIFIATATDDEKATLMKAMGGVTSAQLTQKADEVVTLTASHVEAMAQRAEADKAILVNAKGSVGAILTMINAEQFVGLSSEDKKKAYDEVVLSADGTADMQKLELSLFKASASKQVPQSGGEEGDDTPKAVKDMGGQL